jgi:hypothetical protein
MPPNGHIISHWQGFCNERNKKTRLTLSKACFAQGLALHYKVGNKKRTLQARKVRKYAGAPEGTRTPDLLVRSQSLYPKIKPQIFFQSNKIS